MKPKKNLFKKLKLILAIFFFLLISSLVAVFYVRSVSRVLIELITFVVMVLSIFPIFYDRFTSKTSVKRPKYKANVKKDNHLTHPESSILSAFGVTVFWLAIIFAYVVIF